MQTTARTKSFIEVLEAEIRADLRKEMQSEVQFRTQASAPSQGLHAAGRLESWLASHVGPITFAKPLAARKMYGSVNVKAAPKATAAAAASKTRSEKPVFTASTVEEMIAVEMLTRYSSITLATSFTEDELKSVWRKAALKTHPDRFAGEDQITQMRMTVLFRELAEAYACLTSLTEQAAA